MELQHEFSKDHPFHSDLQYRREFKKTMRPEIMIMNRYLQQVEAAEMEALENSAFQPDDIEIGIDIAVRLDKGRKGRKTGQKTPILL